ncbi:amidohydrolase [Sinomonas sp. ASV322]|uniref:M20 metallopeptidase family protein n=1 Tax=Sinomonas sp. ASV322 TaxID=3041920 RepID=UPI0027DD18A6|nr:amidohydrolase [Sinomonas sp. ASV322]MDQ4504481.1 amidohydrolase [Sinomonas sp. ASV322]
MNWEIDEDALIAWRRDIHANPELGFHETRTSGLVAELLEGYGIEVTRPTPTSVVGLLRGARPGRTVALRADMDALPVEEETGEPFSSKVPGVMHACGHDTHTAMLLAAAKTLAGLRDELAGNVTFLFQHAEEHPPGGAVEIVAAGALGGVDGVFGLHVMNQKAGTVTIARGAASTAYDGGMLTIQGRGSHGSMPQHGIDPVVVGSEIVLALQTVVSRSIAPDHFAVVTVGSFNSGEAPNIIPDTAHLALSVRTTNPEDRETVGRRVREIIAGVCAVHGATYTLDWEPGYEAIQQDDGAAELAFGAAATALGEDRVAWGPGTSASEDFSVYAARVPGCFIFFGGGDESEGFPFQNHHPKFNVKESALIDGARLEVQIALDFLAAE